MCRVEARSSCRLPPRPPPSSSGHQFRRKFNLQESDETQSRPTPVRGVHRIMGNSRRRRFFRPAHSSVCCVSLFCVSHCHEIPSSSRVSSPLSVCVRWSVSTGSALCLRTYTRTNGNRFRSIPSRFLTSSERGVFAALFGCGLSQGLSSLRFATLPIKVNVDSKLA